MSTLGASSSDSERVLHSSSPVAEDCDDILIDDGDTSQGAKYKQQKRSKATQTPGIVYLSRVPPFMRPHKLRHLLSHYGQVGRVYLQPEDESVRQRRIKFKGNKKVKFTEGWVEFLDKSVAKAVATMLNCTPVGHKKRSMYHDDLWNIKYLPKFSWTHLTEKIAYNQATREQRLRTEVSQAKRESAQYLASVDKQREVAAIVDRKRKRGLPEFELAGGMRRKFKQRKVTEIPAPSSSQDKPLSLLSDSLLSKVFAQ